MRDPRPGEEVPVSRVTVECPHCGEPYGKSVPELENALMKSGLLELAKVFNHLKGKLDDIEMAVLDLDIDSIESAIDTVESGVRVLVEDAGYEYTDG